MYGMDTSSGKLVAVDFDNTISAAPALFLEIMRVMEKHGWQVIVVTYRQPNCFPEDLQFLVDKGYKVYYTGQIGKAGFMKNRGIVPNIWIDDEPETILRNFDPSRGEFYD